MQVFIYHKPLSTKEQGTAFTLFPCICVIITVAGMRCQAVILRVLFIILQSFQQQSYIFDYDFGLAHHIQPAGITVYVCVVKFTVNRLGY